MGRRLAFIARGLLALGLLLVLCSPGAAPPFTRGNLRVTSATGPVTLQVEVAASGNALHVGLMHRPRLRRDAGMVFAFQEPHYGGFWMKNTLIPLSIAFWDRSGRILKILDMEPCRVDPCPVYYPGVTYTGAVEVNQGWFAEHGVRPGDRVDLTVR